MICVGIDLAWSDRNPSAGCAIDGTGAIVDESPLGPDDRVLDWIDSLAPDVIAIDAPLLVPNETGMRPCERQLHREYGSRGAGAHPSNRSLLRRTSGRVRGEDLAIALAAKGFGGPWSAATRTAIEVYPHPGLVEVFDLPTRLAYNRVPADQRVERLRALRDLLVQLDSHDPPLSGPPVEIPSTLRGRSAKATEDRLDARFCAWVGLVWALHGTSRIRLFGDSATGHIAVPTRA